MKNDQSLSIFCDGGSRGNPGPAASAFVVYHAQKIIFQKGIFLGVATNNQAEYHAVLSALKYLSISNLQLSIVNFYLDSELVVKQLNKEYKIKDPTLQQLAFEIKNQISNLPLAIINFSHISRSQNSQADALVNSTLDSHL